METATIETFGERQRQLLTLLLETKEGLTADELAERLAISRSATHQHLTARERRKAVGPGSVGRLPMAASICSQSNTRCLRAS